MSDTEYTQTTPRRMKPAVDVDSLALNAAECRILAAVFGFADTAEFQVFAREQQRKYASQQLRGQVAR